MLAIYKLTPIWLRQLALVVLFMIFGAGAYVGINAAIDEGHDAQEDARVAVIRAELAATKARENLELQKERCEAGNEVKEGLQEFFREQLHETRHTDPAIIKVFNLPPAKLAELIEQKENRLLYSIQVRFKISNCEFK